MGMSQSSASNTQSTSAAIPSSSHHPKVSSATPTVKHCSKTSMTAHSSIPRNSASPAHPHASAETSTKNERINIVVDDNHNEKLNYYLSKALEMSDQSGLITLQQLFDKQNCDLITLSKAEKTIIQQSWKTVKMDISAMGAYLFLEMFNKNNNIKDLFHKFRFQNVNELKANVLVKEHGIRVMSIVDRIVQRLDRVDEANQIVINLGKDHIKNKVELDFIMIFTNIFVDMMSITMKSHLLWSDDMQKAWTHLITIVGHLFINGLQQGEKLQNQ